MIAQIAAVVASVGFFGMMCFQILLALGFPLGQAARVGATRITGHPRIGSRRYQSH